MKKEVKKEKKLEVTAKISYHIFEITDGGHLEEPRKKWEDGFLQGAIFDDWNGYSSLEEAKDAIVVNESAKTYPSTKEYLVLPVVKTSVNR